MVQGGHRRPQPLNWLGHPRLSIVKRWVNEVQEAVWGWVSWLWRLIQPTQQTPGNCLIELYLTVSWFRSFLSYPPVGQIGSDTDNSTTWHIACPHRCQFAWHHLCLLHMQFSGLDRIGLLESVKAAAVGEV